MPASVKKVGQKYRVVEPGGKLVRNNAGTPIDGGGHKTEAKASAQARAVNATKHGKKKK